MNFLMALESLAKGGDIGFHRLAWHVAHAEEGFRFLEGKSGPLVIGLIEVILGGVLRADMWGVLEWGGRCGP